ncbi:F-box/kelch-repeat protein At5g60570-like isoform X2 [Oryza glaberrima]|uniref:F-box/kelch-repeat protein At5g60570-like isoform X2 n=1 Tax=Oryza glaberrima TaxID=4538 RepID=UPI00224C592B|nr:F-box/kelch-repeat protein At5g60570-like isoform X2 [Oryza glaberrima]
MEAVDKEVAVHYQYTRCTPMKSNMSGSKVRRIPTIYLMDAHLNGQVLKSAELYNSETGHWETLADMNLARRLSSSFFLDGFYRVMYSLPRVRIAFFSRWSIQM